MFCLSSFCNDHTFCVCVEEDTSVDTPLENEEPTI